MSCAFSAVQTSQPEIVVLTAFESDLVSCWRSSFVRDSLQLTFCVSVGEEADLGFELTRRICLRHCAREGLVRKRALCDDFSNDNDMLLVCLCEVRK
jgi:hypothetical protein